MVDLGKPAPIGERIEGPEMKQIIVETASGIYYAAILIVGLAVGSIIGVAACSTPCKPCKASLPCQCSPCKCEKCQCSILK